MGYVPGYDWDLFISYAHVDNVPVPPDTVPWVQGFRGFLEPLLKQRLGEGYGDLTIFVDDSNQTVGSSHEKMIKAAANAASFLPVVSRSYFTRPFIEREIKAFMASGPVQQRVFPIQLHAQRSDDRYPDWLSTTTYLPFWSETDKLLLTPHQYPHLFNRRLQQLVESIGDQLIQMRHSAQASPSPEKKRGESTGVTILLAQAAGSVEEDRESVRNYLVQLGHCVLPDGDDPRRNYPQGGSDFREAIAGDLAKADIFVQLLGRRPTLRPPDLQEGYDRYQLTAALAEQERRMGTGSARNLAVFCWRHPEQRDVEDAQHRELLNSSVTIDGPGLQELKTMIRQRAEDMLLPVQLPSPDPFVFINADVSDADAATAYLNECVERGLEAYVRASAGSPEEITKLVKEQMQNCAALVHLYGNSPQVWVQSQVRFFSRNVKGERKSPPRTHALFIGPPEPKPDPGVAVKGLETIRCAGGFGLEPLRKLLSQLQ